MPSILPTVTWFRRYSNRCAWTLGLSNSGVALLTGPPLALFYVSIGIPISWLADRSNRPQHSGVLAHHLVGVHRDVRAVRRATCSSCWRAWASASARRAGPRPRQPSFQIAFLPTDGRWRWRYWVWARPSARGWARMSQAPSQQAHGWRSAFIALGIPGLLMGVLVYLTVSEPGARPVGCGRTQHQSHGVGVDKIHVEATRCFPRGDGRRTVRIMGLGFDVRDSHLLAAHLSLERGGSGRRLPAIFIWWADRWRPPPPRGLYRAAT